MEKNLQINNNFDELVKVTEFVEEICDELNLSPSLVMSINLALEEAIVNIINYAYDNPECKGEIKLFVGFRDDVLTFILTDKGVAFDPTLVPEADITLSAEDRPIGGLGIFLIRQIMDKVSYERINDNNILEMTKKIVH